MLDRLNSDEEFSLTPTFAQVPYNEVVKRIDSGSQVLIEFSEILTDRKDLEERNIMYSAKVSRTRIYEHEIHDSTSERILGFYKNFHLYLSKAQVKQHKQLEEIIMRLDDLKVGRAASINKHKVQVQNCLKDIGQCEEALEKAKKTFSKARADFHHTRDKLAAAEVALTEYQQRLAEQHQRQAEEKLRREMQSGNNNSSNTSTVSNQSQPGGSNAIPTSSTGAGANVSSGSSSITSQHSGSSGSISGSSSSYGGKSSGGGFSMGRMLSAFETTPEQERDKQLRKLEKRRTEMHQCHQHILYKKKALLEKISVMDEVLGHAYKGFQTAEEERLKKMKRFVHQFCEFERKALTTRSDLLKTLEEAVDAQTPVPDILAYIQRHKDTEMTHKYTSVLKLLDSHYIYKLREEEKQLNDPSINNSNNHAPQNLLMREPTIIEGEVFAEIHGIETPDKPEESTAELSDVVSHNTTLEQNAKDTVGNIELEGERSDVVEGDSLDMKTMEKRRAHKSTRRGSEDLQTVYRMSVALMVLFTVAESEVASTTAQPVQQSNTQALKLLREANRAAAAASSTGKTAQDDTDEEFDDGIISECVWYDLIRSPNARDLFLQELDEQRGRKALLNAETYASMANAMKAFLDYCDEQGDAQTAMRIANMANTFHTVEESIDGNEEIAHNTDESTVANSEQHHHLSQPVPRRMTSLNVKRKYLQVEEKFHDHPIWRKQGFWAAALKDGTFQQLDLIAGGNDAESNQSANLKVGNTGNATKTFFSGSSPRGNDCASGNAVETLKNPPPELTVRGILWDELPPEALRETVVNVHNIIFGQLGMLAFAMQQRGLTPQEVEQHILRMSRQAQLAEDQEHDLISAVRVAHPEYKEGSDPANNKEANCETGTEGGTAMLVAQSDSVFKSSPSEDDNESTESGDLELIRASMSNYRHSVHEEVSIDVKNEKKKSITNSSTTGTDKSSQKNEDKRSDSSKDVLPSPPQQEREVTSNSGSFFTFFQSTNSSKKIPVGTQQKSSAVATFKQDSDALIESPTAANSTAASEEIPADSSISPEDIRSSNNSQVEVTSDAPQRSHSNEQLGRKSASISATDGTVSNPPLVKNIAKSSSPKTTRSRLKWSLGKGGGRKSVNTKHSTSDDIDDLIAEL